MIRLPFIKTHTMRRVTKFQRLLVLEGIVFLWLSIATIPAGNAFAFSWPSSFPSFNIDTNNQKTAAAAASIKAKQAQDALQTLEALIDQAPKNGIGTSDSLATEIVSICESLKALTPFPKPTQDPQILSGFWKMRWTNFYPVAPSSGQLGPFVGDVFQDIDLLGNRHGKAKNILRIGPFPPIVGALIASPSIVDDTTAAITFEQVSNQFAGFLPLGPKIQFEAGKEVRLWEHIYVDQDYRILYARRRDDPVTEEEEADDGDDTSPDKKKNPRGFIFVMKRADEERFDP